MSFNKTIRDVADVAAKIMAEKLHPNQQVLDVHEPEKDKLTAQDFKKLRAMKKEEAEVQQEGWDDMMKAVKDRSGPQPSGGAGVKKGRAYGGSAQKDKPEQDVDKPKKKKLSEMVAMYKESGLKSLAEMTKVEQINEEPTSDEFKKEVDKAKAKSEGKDTADVASASVQAVKQESVELEERHMTEPEMKKREEIVKSMKKGLSGFKQRYGERAKSVMYATATKQAMKEETDTESEHYKAGHEYGADHALDSGFKVTARARKKEMLADNPHKKGTKEHADWHRGALDGHQIALDNM